MIRTKTWKIGEYARGGVITTQVQGKVLTIIGKEWDFSTGSRRSSNQSNAKEFIRETIAMDGWQWDRKALDFLNDLTTSYYADNILKWVKS